MSLSRVTLEVIEGPHSGEKFAFHDHDSLLAGRAEEAQLRLAQDMHFSRNHFRIEVKPPNCHLVDLDSSNGTYVNGERVDDAWLGNGDTISGGHTRILVKIEGNDQGATQLIQMPPEPDETIRPDELSAILHYDVLSELGRGSMGVVYHARHSETGEEVAVKVISPQMQADDKAVDVFIREATILRRLDHKRIVRFVETGLFEGAVFLAMEYVPTVDLAELLTKQSIKRRVRIACGLTRQILDGLAYAHSQDLVHRDIKPGNLLVAMNPNKTLSAKLADFGLAKNFMEAGMSQISCENEIKGTLSFMAPEQVVSCRYARPSADIFSVGATLYSLVAGEMIYDMRDHRTPLAAVLNQGPVPLMQRVPDAPPALTRIVAKALARDPDDRFASAEEMREALEPLT